MASFLLALLLTGCAPQDAEVTGTWHVWLAANNSATVDEGKLDLAERATRIYDCARGWDADRGDFEMGYIGPRPGDTIGEGSRFFGGDCDPADTACDQDLLDAQCAEIAGLEFYTFLQGDGYYYLTEPLDPWRTEAVMNGEGDFQLTVHNRLGNGQDMRFNFSIKPEFAPLECVDTDGDGTASVEYVDGRSWSEAWSEDEDGYTIYYLNAGSFQVDPSTSGDDTVFWYFNSDWSAGFAHAKFAAEEFSVHPTDYGNYDESGAGQNFDLIEEYRNQCGASRDDIPPLAAIAGGDRNVGLGEAVNLDGTASTDPDGDELTYFWSVSAPADSSASLLVDTPTASFIADAPGTYTVTLTVNDGAWSTSDTITVTVEDPNHAPNCYALPGDTVAMGTTASLDAGPTYDPDGDALTYNWRIQGQVPKVDKKGNIVVDDDGNVVTESVDDSFEDAGPTLDYVLGWTGYWTVTLEAVDPSGASCASQTTWEVYDPADGPPASKAPNCSAGVDMQGRYGDQFDLLDGVAVDPDGTDITYSWAIASAPAGSTAEVVMADPAGASSAASFTADRSGQYRLAMTATDAQDESCISEIVVDVRNNPPLCDVPANAWAASGEPVELAINGLSDPDGDDVSGYWELAWQPTCSDPEAGLLVDHGDGTATLDRDVDGFYEANWIASDGDKTCYRTVTVQTSCDAHYLGGYTCHQDDAEAWAREISHVAMAGTGVDEAIDGDPGFVHRTESNFWRPIDDRDAGLDGWAEVSSSWIRVKDGSTLEEGGSAEGDFQILLEGFESSSVMVVEGTFKVDRIRGDKWAYPDLEEQKRDENGTPYCGGDTLDE